MCDQVRSVRGWVMVCLKAAEFPILEDREKIATGRIFGCGILFGVAHGRTLRAGTRTVWLMLKKKHTAQ